MDLPLIIYTYFDIEWTARGCQQWCHMKKSILIIWIWCCEKRIWKNIDLALLPWATHKSLLIPVINKFQNFPWYYFLSQQNREGTALDSFWFWFGVALESIWFQFGFNLVKNLESIIFGLGLEQSSFWFWSCFGFGLPLFYWKNMVCPISGIVMKWTKYHGISEFWADFGIYWDLNTHLVFHKHDHLCLP